MRDLPLYTALLASCAALCGCPVMTDNGSSDAGQSQSAACSPLNGTYQFTYQLQSGNCGPQPDELLKFVNGRSASSVSQNCQAGGESMVTACDLQRNSTCSVSDSLTGGLLGQAHVSGTLSEISDNTHVQGVLAVTITDTTGASCQSTYAVSGTLVQ